MAQGPNALLPRFLSASLLPEGLLGERAKAQKSLCPGRGGLGRELAGPKFRRLPSSIYLPWLAGGWSEEGGQVGGASTLILETGGGGTLAARTPCSNRGHPGSLLGPATWEGGINTADQNPA